jgi:hypothetical protein
VKVIIGCEFSGIVRESFRARGHDAWSCDLLPSEIPGYHIQDDILNYIGPEYNWDLAIFHPPCTYLTNAGVCHLHANVVSKNGKRAAINGEERMEKMRESAEFFNKLLNAPIPRVVVENPIPHKYARAIIGKYSQIIQPFMFGVPETKKTCFWLKNLPLLQPTNLLPALLCHSCFGLGKIEGSTRKCITCLGVGKLNRRPRVHREPPGPDRWKNRSRTPQGIANALADQYGKLLDD